MKSSRCLFLMIFALAVFLRLYHLGWESLWFDEGWTVRVAHLPPVGVIADAANDVHPPLYYFIMSLWVRLFGDSEWAVRLPSVIFGLGMLLFLYRLGCVMFGERTALLSTFLLAVSTFHINYCQETRSYSLLALGATASLYYFWLLLKRPSPRAALGYLLASAALMYTHNFGLLVLLAQWVYVAGLWAFTGGARRGRRLAWWFGLQALLALAYLPWVGMLLSQVNRIRQGFWIPMPTLISLAHTAVEYSGSRILLLVFFPLALWAFMRWGELPEREPPPAAATSWRRLAHRVIDRSRLPENLFLGLLIVIPNVVPFVVSRLLAPMYTTKSTIFCIPALYLLVAHATVKLRRRWARVGAVALISVLAFQAFYAGSRQPHKEPWREAVADVESRAGRGDLLLFNWGMALDNVYLYYSRRPDLVKRVFPPADNGLTIDAAAMRQLDPLIKGHDRVWVIFNREGDQQGVLRGRLRQLYHESFHKFYQAHESAIELFGFERPWLAAHNYT